MVDNINKPYQVLARRYRPTCFSELKGQDAFVQVATNAIRQNKIAHAYLLTGIRGIGKTTIARIIAKTVNCTNLDLSSAKLDPCGKCDNCTAMQEQSHPDIIEIDAASKTGVNDIREVIEATKFKALLGRYKIYIIDEVHMLSNNAFNALLKTLEEPPEYLIFIFATTEFRKIPLTIISRCQKFDLHRFSIQDLTNHLEYICQKEKIKASNDALKLIAKFSEGSVRDSLSLLETVNIYRNNDVEITTELVADTLGLPDLVQNYKMLNFIINGNTDEAIKIARKMYHKGTEVSLILQELLHLCSKITKFIALNNFAEDSDLPDYEKTLLTNTANKIDIKNITTIWKMIFKGVEELKYYANALDLLEILIIRICHLSTLPPLEDVIKGFAQNLPNNNSSAIEKEEKFLHFKDIVALFRKNQEMVLHHYLIEEVRLVDYKPGKIQAQINDNLPENFTSMIISKLNEWTSIKWEFMVVRDDNAAFKTIKKQNEETVENHHLVREILKSFPGAKIKNIVEVN